MIRISGSATGKSSMFSAHKLFLKTRCRPMARNHARRPEKRFEFHKSSLETQVDIPLRRAVASLSPGEVSGHHGQNQAGIWAAFVKLISKQTAGRTRILRSAGVQTDTSRRNPDEPKGFAGAASEPPAFLHIIAYATERKSKTTLARDVIGTMVRL